MANTPWLLRETDPQWRDDHDYTPGAHVTGSDGQFYFCVKACGPNTDSGSQDPVSTTNYWESLANSIAQGGNNEVDLSSFASSGEINSDISGNAATATKLLNARTIDGVGFDGTASIIHYGTCATAASTASKIVSIDNFSLEVGAVVYVKFNNTNTNTAPLLNVSSTGGASIQYNGAAYTALFSGCVYSFVYDGSVWNLAGGGVVAPPIGAIMMFSGSFGGTNNRYPIPAGSSTPDTNWCLCDGTTTNGYTVPDLRNRFIVGAGSTYSSGSTGGSTTHTHSFSGTVGSTTLTTSQMPSHRHSGYVWKGTGSVEWAAEPYEGRTDGYMGTTGSSSSHTHSLSSVSSGSASSLPPYYALSYIMRIM